MSFKKQLFAYIRSMRPYLFFISGMAGLIGVVFSGHSIQIGKVFLILGVLFVGWGVNQIINDILGINEDRINAPHRPMVTGELPIRTAVIISAFLLFFGGIISYHLNPYSLFFYFFVFALNVVYQYSKRLPVGGNIIFGVLLAPCVYYGAMCINGKGVEIILDSQLFPLAFAIALINAVMCYFTYFKDYEGDRLTGNKTIVVLLTPERAKHLNFLLCAIPFLSILLIKNANYAFFVFLLITFIVLQYAAYLFFCQPQGDNAFYALRWVFVGSVFFETSFIALLNPYLAGLLFIVVCVIMNLLFILASDCLA